MKLPFNKSGRGNSGMLSNSIWGLVSTVLQTLFLSLLFIITSRYYKITDFSNFLIATTIYQLIVGFSSMGLGHWFVREYEQQNVDRQLLVSKFVKIQTILGMIFYVVSIGLTFALYEDYSIRLLSIILGTNIIFDNIIYALKSLNIAQWQQRKTSAIMAIDGMLRLGVGCLLFFFPISIFYFSALSVVIRLFTLNIFVTFGSSGDLSIAGIWKFKVTISDFQKQVLANWRFIVIAGLAIIFWRNATLVISKFLTATDVANYEVSYKIFSVFNILPIVASTTIYPKLVSLIARDNFKSARKVYQTAFWAYTTAAIVCYAFIHSYASAIIALAFGKTFAPAAECLKEMMLTFLIFPTVFLQANILLAIKMEKVDMYCNIFALVLNLSMCFIGLHFYKSLSVINYSIFGSFVAFHLVQTIVLIRNKISSVNDAFLFYGALLFFVFVYQYTASIFNESLVFIGFAMIVLTVIIAFFKNIKSQFSLSATSNAVPVEVPEF
jgi:O-antigen/teichoic acid export membrane protein